MKHSDLRAIVRNLALDRDGAVSGTPAGTDVARILNDHISRFGAMNSDRSTYATSTGASFSIADGKFSKMLSLTNVLRILSVTREASSSTIDSTPIELCMPADIYHLRSKGTASGTVAYMAFVRLAGQSNKFRAICHPPSSGTTTLSIHYLPFEREFTISTLDDTEVTDLPQHAQYAIARETAVDIANILHGPGRGDQFIDSIAARAGDAEALYAGMLGRNMGPNEPVDRPK